VSESSISDNRIFIFFNFPLIQSPRSLRTMTEPNLETTAAPAPSTPAPASKITPLRCFLGAIVAGAIAFALYNMTTAIAITFANRVIHSDNMIIIRMSTAVRTLVIGMAAMGTGIFGMATIGLTGLGIQVLLGKYPEPSSPK
jgi:Protein of unknown function (DUF3082)